MKRILSLIMIAVTVFSLVSCGKKKYEKYCYSCGEGISREVAFCGYCGVSVNEISKTETTTETTTEIITTTVHTHTYSEEVTPATCSKKGFTTFTCICGDSYVDNYTGPSHNYVKYVCTDCKKVDKSHAYEYLIEWVKENGAVFGEHIIFKYKENETGSDIGIGYNVSEDYLYISISDEDGLLTIDLSAKNKNFDFYHRHEPGDEYLATGKINGKTFVEEGPVVFENYDGPSGKKETFVKFTSIRVSWLLVCVRAILKHVVETITIKDLGFANF